MLGQGVEPKKFKIPRPIDSWAFESESLHLKDNNLKVLPEAVHLVFRARKLHDSSSARRHLNCQILPGPKAHHLGHRPLAPPLQRHPRHKLNNAACKADWCLSLQASVTENPSPRLTSTEHINGVLSYATQQHPRDRSQWRCLGRWDEEKDDNTVLLEYYSIPKHNTILL